MLQPGKKSLFITGLGQFPALFVSAPEREVRVTRFDPKGRTGIAQQAQVDMDRLTAGMAGEESESLQLLCV